MGVFVSGEQMEFPCPTGLIPRKQTIEPLGKPTTFMPNIPTQSGNSVKYPKYFKDVTNMREVDVYQVHHLFGIDDPSGAIQHASKKLLLSGVRTGGKSKYEDIREARDTLNRWLEINQTKD